MATKSETWWCIKTCRGTKLPWTTATTRRESWLKCEQQFGKAPSFKAFRRKRRMFAVRIRVSELRQQKGKRK